MITLTPTDQYQQSAYSELLSTSIYGTDEYLYVWTNEGIAQEIEIDWENIPLITNPKSLHEYRIWAGGKDYLYFARSQEEASNYEYIDLLIFDNSECDQEEDLEY